MTDLQITAEAAKTVFTSNDRRRMIDLLLNARTALDTKCSAITRSILDKPQDLDAFFSGAAHDEVDANPAIQILRNAIRKTQEAIDTLAAVDDMSLPYVRV